MLLQAPAFHLGEFDERAGDTILQYVVSCSKPLPRVTYGNLTRSGSHKFYRHPWLGGAPINCAIRKQNMHAPRTMLKKWEEDLSCKDKITGATIVHDTVDTGVVEILKMLLDAGASPHMINLQTGRFPIHHDVEKDSFEMASLLIPKAISYNEEEMTGNTSLHIVVMSGHGFVIYFLRYRYAYPSVRNPRGRP